MSNIIVCSKDYKVKPGEEEITLNKLSKYTYSSFLFSRLSCFVASDIYNLFSNASDRFKPITLTYVKDLQQSYNHQQHIVFVKATVKFNIPDIGWGFSSYFYDSLKKHFHVVKHICGGEFSIYQFYHPYNLSKDCSIELLTSGFSKRTKELIKLGIEVDKLKAVKND